LLKTKTQHPQQIDFLTAVAFVAKSRKRSFNSKQTNIHMPLAKACSKPASKSD